jgi:hypothetical protein
MAEHVAHGLPEVFASGEGGARIDLEERGEPFRGRQFAKGRREDRRERAATQERMYFKDERRWRHGNDLSKDPFQDEACCRDARTRAEPHWSGRILLRGAALCDHTIRFFASPRHVSHGASSSGCSMSRLIA